MTTEREVDADILKLAATSLEADGYTVLLEPSASILPDPLKGLQPDGIAIGKKPFLVIELTREGAQSLARVQKLHDAIRGDSEWQLHLLFTGGKPSEMDTLPLAYIKDTVHNIEGVAKEDARPALLMCWAYLEALARSLEPKSLSRPQSAIRVVEQLASLGYVGPADAAFLREMSEKRNKLAHGQLTIVVAQSEVAQFIRIIDDIIGWSLTKLKVE